MKLRTKMSNEKNTIIAHTESYVVKLFDWLTFMGESIMQASIKDSRCLLQRLKHNTTVIKKWLSLTIIAL